MTRVSTVVSKVKNNTKTKKTTKTDPKKKTNTKEPKQKRKRSTTSKYFTHDGHPLTPLEAKFIDLYIETGNQRQSIIQAGYKTNSPSQVANKLLNKDHISNEIAYRLKVIEDSKTASAKEILEYFTGVMRGEILDQFGLEAPLSERTKAAQELAKRTIDIANRVAGKEVAEVKIKLDWSGFDDDENGIEETGDTED